MTQKELEQKVIDAEGRVAKREAVLKKHNSQLAKMIEKGADRFDISIKREDIKSATTKLAEARETLANWTGENRATAFRYEASPICRASFPSTLDEDGARCTVEVTVYRLNAVAATAFMLDGPETLLRHIGLDERDTYTTKHEIDDLVTVVHITREEAPAWQH